MANYAQMSSKKLNKLVNEGNLSEEQINEIKEVLAQRENASGASEGITQGPAPEETKVVEEANTAEETSTTEVKAPKKKLTDEELKALCDKLRVTHLNHRCEVVPFNTVEWVPGTIVGVLEEKRSSKAMLAIKTDDGRRIVKLPDSPLLKVLDEVVETPKKTRSNKKQALDADGNPIELGPWSEEDIEEAVQKVIGNVGKLVTFPEAGKYGEVEEGAANVTGRITSLVPNKRGYNIMYRVEIPGPNGTKIVAHKVTDNPLLVLADSLDEEGQKINDAFTTRRYKEDKPKVTLTPEEALTVAETALNKAAETLKKAQALYDKRQAAYDAARDAYEKASEANIGAITEANDENRNDADLM